MHLLIKTIPKDNWAWTKKYLNNINGRDRSHHKRR